MGDSGEGLIDAEARIQERMEEMQMDREQGQKPVIKNREELRQIESLKLARKEMTSQLEKTTHPARKAQINHALADLDRRIDEIAAAIGQ